MRRMKKLGVYLNNEPGDKEALAFVNLITRLGHPDSIHCINVRGIEDPAVKPAPEEEAVRGQAMEILSRELMERTQVHVSEATGLGEILRSARNLDLDLIVVGRRLPHDQMGVGSNFYRLARKSPCNVLVVPDGAVAKLERLLVLIDGSEHSRMALEMAFRAAKASGGDSLVVAQSVYSVGYGYSYAGMSFEEATRHYESLTRERIVEFLADVDTSGAPFEVVYTCAKDTAEAAYDLASAKQMDAILIGSRGPTLPAIALLGATTERILLNAPLPVLVVKRKGETFNFLDAVLDQF